MSEHPLYQRYLQLKQQGVHQRDAVARLGISEGELVSVFPETEYLGSDVMAFLPELAALGVVKSVIRNRVAVHEKRGTYTNVDLSPMMGTAINMGGLDLRLFLKRWKHIFKVSMNGLHSFQFYDEYGKAIQKVFVGENALPQWQALGEKYRSGESPVFAPQPQLQPYQPRRLSDSEISEYRQQWRSLKNVHHFRAVLAAFDIDRVQGLEYAPEGDAQRLNADAVEFIFRQCAERGLTLLTFVNNGGMVQIQTGKVHHVGRAEGYLNILDDREEGFSLHLKDDELAQVWFVRRPGSTGTVHSFEAYDDRRGLVLQLFGRQADADSEPQAWRDLVADTVAQFGL